ncbi:MAG: DUF2520 domain-containing protein [Clostridium sp.]|nr:DUF2520 domain-containing protein [Clostridium sp.]
MDHRARITYIGAGNVAWSLAPALDAVADVTQVYSPTLDHAEALARRLKNCRPIDSLSAISPDADFCIISVKDDAVAEVAKAMPKIKGIVAHTSGSVPAHAISEASNLFGVFYPLQTFSKADAVDVSQVPFFIEGNSPEAFQALSSLARQISARVYEADSAKRATLHLAAVFACNFANNLWGISADILAKDGYGLDVLKPLLEATLTKAMRMHPYQAQTGPAARGDENVMAKHRSMLSGLDLSIYETLSQSIANHISK